jgi:hypothetical protein
MKCKNIRTLTQVSCLVLTSCRGPRRSLVFSWTQLCEAQLITAGVGGRVVTSAQSTTREDGRYAEYNSFPGLLSGIPVM